MEEKFLTNEADLPQSAEEKMSKEEATIPNVDQTVDERADFLEVKFNKETTTLDNLLCKFPLEPLFNKRLYAVIIEAEEGNDVVKTELLCDGKSIYSKELTFDEDMKILRYGAPFKELKLKLVGEKVTFKKAKLVYCDGKTY